MRPEKHAASCGDVSANVNVNVNVNDNGRRETRCFLGRE
jgi:hypothetical protein